MDGWRPLCARHTISFIEHSDADIICLQETNEDWERTLNARPAIRQRFPYVSFTHDKWRQGGLAFLSKLPMSAVGVLPRLYTNWYFACRVTVHPPSDAAMPPFQIIQVHLKAPVPSVPILVQQQRGHEIRSHMGAYTPSLPAIVLGDFNCSTGPAMRFMTAEMGFTNCLLDGARQQRRGRTTWKGCCAKTLCCAPQLFDHIFVKGFDVVDCRVLHEGGSDHWPVQARVIIS
mmetsp:Transcript_2150/g.5804  ORF Transcript_2150/g.5804 Transcript_2150/m.5804 type:complete len:231 (-) Transcript_2150:911-1603(-)